MIFGKLRLLQKENRLLKMRVNALEEMCEDANQCADLHLHQLAKAQAEILHLRKECELLWKEREQRILKEGGMRHDEH